MKAKLFFVLPLLAFTLFVGVKLHNISIAGERMNKCYIIPSQLVIFKTVRFTQQPYEIYGNYGIVGTVIIVPFEEEIPMQALEDGLKQGVVEEIECD